jgi:hypothetical protein
VLRRIKATNVSNCSETKAASIANWTKRSFAAEVSNDSTRHGLKIRSGSLFLVMRREDVRFCAKNQKRLLAVGDGGLLECRGGECGKDWRSGRVLTRSVKSALLT